jgi:hypothetical protein
MENPWQVFWLGVNATAAAAWSAISAGVLVLVFTGDRSLSATVATASLLGGLAWLVAAIRAIKEARTRGMGLFWFAVSATLGAAGALISGASLDLTHRSEAFDQSGITAIAVAMACSLVWFAISVWGAMNLVGALRRGR